MRTTETAIREVMDTALTSPQVVAFATDASLWVTEELAFAGLSPERMELIERYLACALIRVRDLGLTSQTILDTREQYQVDPKVSEYLKSAASFDPTGTVTRVFVKQAAKVVAKVGKTFSHPRNRRFRT